jgi:hypothetical protein
LWGGLVATAVAPPSTLCLQTAVRLSTYSLLPIYWELTLLLFSRLYIRFPIYCVKVSQTALMITMIISTTLLLLVLAGGGNAYVLARRVEQSLENRGSYQGGWMLNSPESCPQNYSTDCSADKNAANRVCCPSGNTCFGSYIGYCCPTCTYLLLLCDSVHYFHFGTLTKSYSSRLRPIRDYFPCLRRSNCEYVRARWWSILLLRARPHRSFTLCRLWFL